MLLEFQFSFLTLVFAVVGTYYSNLHIFFYKILEHVRWLCGRSFASHAGDRDSISGRDRPKLLKQVVTTPRPNAGQQVRVSQEEWHAKEHYPLNGYKCRA